MTSLQRSRTSSPCVVAIHWEDLGYILWTRRMPRECEAVLTWHKVWNFCSPVQGMVHFQRVWGQSQKYLKVSIWSKWWVPCGYSWREGQSDGWRVFRWSGCPEIYTSTPLPCCLVPSKRLYSNRETHPRRKRKLPRWRSPVAVRIQAAGSKVVSKKQQEQKQSKTPVLMQSLRCTRQ